MAKIALVQSLGTAVFLNAQGIEMFRLANSVLSIAPVGVFECMVSIADFVLYDSITIKYDKKLQKILCKQLIYYI